MRRRRNGQDEIVTYGLLRRRNETRWNYPEGLGVPPEELTMNNNLLGFLRSRPRAVGEAFRTNPRHQSRRRAMVSWKQGRDTRTVKARLIDISRMGVALAATTPP